jgi:hypothetical protein
MSTIMNASDTLPSAAVVPAPLSTLSLLVPFDIGQTFIFKSRAAKPEDDWTKIFSGADHAQDWSVDQGELDGFSKSMGWIAIWRYFEGAAKPKLDKALEKLRKHVPGDLEESRDGIRAIIFPNGIGVLIVRIRAAPLDDPRWLTMQSAGQRKQRRAACRVFLSTVAACYLNFMYDAIRRHAKGEPRVIERLQPVGRAHGIVRAEYTYPLHFFNPDDEAKWLAAHPKANETGYGSARLFIDWKSASISQGSAERTPIECIFIVALAGWFALHVMNNRATHYILNAIYGLASSHHDPDATEGWAVRLAYMEAANQAFPIQWTSTMQDLNLLETIHTCWGSDRWWKQVERKTSLLAAHAEQLEAESNERWNRRIAGVGATIACFTLASAIADVMDLTGGPNWLKLALVLGVPAILGIGLGYWVWSSLRTPGRKPDSWGDYRLPSGAFELPDEVADS